ncbi:MAG TPA: hypothetical protein VEA69_13435 [Tepidisphaeraceae bacterium]|nr:hypothetical protein [Tepidisphaeraceae bacterium]
MRRHICGTPADHCSGSNTCVDKDWVRTHSTAEEAFECHQRHLLRSGFVQIGPRELIDPTDGYVRVLTRKMRFGASVRRGKGAESGSAVGNRLADMDPGAFRVSSL